MPFELWLAYLATSAIILAIPGPTILLVLSYSVSQGRSATMPLVAGVALGDSVAIVPGNLCQCSLTNQPGRRIFRRRRHASCQLSC